MTSGASLSAGASNLQCGGRGFRAGAVWTAVSHMGLTLLDWLERTIADAVNTSLDAALLCRLLELARDHTAILDEITCPQLLHGDLWLFNLLIERTKEGPRIVGRSPWRIGLFSCCPGVPARRNRRSSGKPMGNQSLGPGRCFERRSIRDYTRAKSCRSPGGMATSEQSTKPITLWQMWPTCSSSHVHRSSPLVEALPVRAEGAIQASYSGLHKY
jgi:hypothetical protein